MEYIPSYTDSLMHHGIKRMHWGVRRFQNPDGTLTKDGEKRYLKKLNKAASNEMVSDYFVRSHSNNIKRLEDLKANDPKRFRKEVPVGLLNQEKSKLNTWTKRNNKDVKKVKKYMSKMNLDKKHLVYDVLTGEYSIVED